MAAGQAGHPVVFIILMETNNRLLHGRLLQVL
jgi:hypothetical protein